MLQNKSTNFDLAGAFYESVNYANYALSEYLKYRLAYANVFPHRPQRRFPALSGLGFVPHGQRRRQRIAQQLTQPERRYFVSGAGYLRRGGRVLLDSLSKVDAVWQPGSRTEVFIHGQDEIEASIGAESR